MDSIELINIPLLTSESVMKVNTVFEKKKLNLLLGQNGSGKTSVLRFIAGQIIPKKGSIKLEDNVIFHFDKLTLKQLRKFLQLSAKQTCYIEDTNFLYEHATIYENISYFMKLNNINPLTKKKQLIELKEYFQIKEELDTVVKFLSKGTKQKILIILSLLFDKEIILMDEPTSGLDINSEEKFFKLAANKNCTFIITSHTQLDLDLPQINKIMIQDVLLK